MRTPRRRVSNTDALALSGLLAMDETIGRLNSKHLQMLVWLASSGEAVPVMTLSAQFGVSLPYGSRLIDRLHSLGLVHRIERPELRSTKDVSATRAGRALADRIEIFLTGPAPKVAA